MKEGGWKEGVVDGGYVESKERIRSSAEVGAMPEIRPAGAADGLGRLSAVLLPSLPGGGWRPDRKSRIGLERGFRCDGRAMLSAKDQR